MPASLWGPVVPVFACTVRCDLEVLAELLVSRLPPQRHDVLTQFVPVQIESEGIEQECLWDEVVKRQHADLLKQVRQKYVVVRLETLFQEASECWRSRLAVKHRHDPDERGRMLRRDATKVTGRRSMHTTQLSLMG
jgi:hypothetical protein